MNNTFFRHRGDGTENLINAINYVYLIEKKAIIDKVPTPIKVLKIQYGKIKDGYFEKDSTVDYYGSVDGIPFCFDSKETALKSFPLKNLHQHQVDYMTNFRDIGKGFSFIICHSTSDDIYYFITLEKILQYWNGYLDKTGRKSIPFSDLSDCIIPQRDGLPDYLVPLKNYIKSYRR